MTRRGIARVAAQRLGGAVGDRAKRFWDRFWWTVLRVLARPRERQRARAGTQRVP